MVLSASWLGTLALASITGLLPTLALAANTGSLKIKTDPKGAEVLVDSIPRGTSPAKVKDLLPGRHLVEARLGEHAPVAEVVVVKSGRTHRLKLKLSKEMGRLEIQASPGAPVYVDERFAGRAPGPIWVPAGKHKVRVVSAEGQAFEKEVEVATGQESLVTPPFLCKLVVETSPPGIPVKLDSKSIGASPASVKIPAGKHRIVVSAPRFEESSQEVVVAPGKESRTRVVLRPSRRVWSRPLAKTEGAPLVVGGLILWRTASSVLAIDAESGKERWRFDPQGEITGVRLSGEVLFVAHAAEGNGGLTALTVADGGKQWTVAVRGAIAGRPVFLDAPPRVAVGSGAGRLYVLDAATGKAVTEKALEKMQGLPNGPPVHLVGQTVFTTTSGWAMALDGKGRIAWKQRVGALPPPPPVGADGAVVVWGAWTKGPRSRIHVFDAATGKRRWAHDFASAPGDRVWMVGNTALAQEGTKLVGLRLDKAGRAFAIDVGGPVRSAISALDGALVAAGSTLLRVDPAQGAITWKAKLSGPACKPIVLADTILLGAGKELVALDAKTGARRWSYPTKGLVCEVAAAGSVVGFAAGGVAVRLDTKLPAEGAGVTDKPSTATP